MSRHLLHQLGFGVLATVTLTLAGCTSTMYTGSNQAPAEVIAGSAENTGFWNRAKLWIPKVPMGITAEQQVKDPGKLHLAYARWQEKLGNLVEARESYELALGDSPRSTDAILGLARLDQLNNRNFEAEQRFLKALKLKPDDPNVLDAVGQYYASQERWDRSVELLTQAVRVSPHDTTHRFNLAVALARAGRVNQAMPHFAQTVGDAEAHYNVGYILYQQDDLVGAERHLLQAVISHPELTQAQQMLDEVRRDQADRTMFAGGRRPATSRQAATSRPSDPDGGRYIQTGHRNENNDRTASNTREFSSDPDVRPKTPAASNAAAPHDYRRQFQRRQTPTENRVRTTSSVPLQTNDRRSPPPWHTSPAFDRAPVTSQRQTHSQPSANGLPATNQPTPEQLEQWRNQFSSSNNAPRN